jgi:hypothetical protein
VVGNIDAEHLAGDAAIEALYHAVRLGRIGRLGRTMANLDFRACAFKIFVGEAGTPIRQHISDTAGEGLPGDFLEGNRIGGVLDVVDVEVDKREQRSIVTQRKRLRISPSAVRNLGKCLTSMWTKPISKSWKRPCPCGAAPSAWVVVD